MRRIYASKIVPVGRGFGPKTRLLMVPGVDYDPNNGESIEYIAPLQDLETGQYLNNHFFVVVDVKNHSKLLADPDHTPAPDFPSDGSWKSIAVSVRNNFKAKLPDLGFSPAEILALDGKDGFREVLDAWLAKLQPGVNYANLEANLTAG